MIIKLPVSYLWKMREILVSLLYLFLNASFIMHTHLSIPFYLRLLFVLSICLSACQGDQSYDEQSVSYAPEAEPDMRVQQVSDEPDADIPVPQQRYIIRNGHISIEVEDYQQSRIALAALITKQGGYISQEQERTSDYNISNELTIRIPNTVFDSTMNQIAALALHVSNRQVQAIDVSEEYVDIETRLATKKAVEARYIGFLKQAKSVEEIIQIEEAIRKIREEIESREGRLKYLKNQISLSTIEVYMSQETEHGGYQAPSFWSRIGKGFVAGWEGILAVIVGFAHIWPLVLLIGAGGWMILARRRRRKA